MVLLSLMLNTADKRKHELKSNFGVIFSVRTNVCDNLPDKKEDNNITIIKDSDALERVQRRAAGGLQISTTGLQVLVVCYSISTSNPRRMQAYQSTDISVHDPERTCGGSDESSRSGSV